MATINAWINTDLIPAVLGYLVKENIDNMWEDSAHWVPRVLSNESGRRFSL